MYIPNEVFLALFLWIALSFLTSKYIVSEFKLHHLLACLLLSVIFIAMYMIIGAFLSAIGIGTIEVALITATWIMFLVARSFIETTNWRVRENVLFAALIIAYILLVIVLAIVAALS